LLNEIKKRNQFLIQRLRQETFHHSNKSGKYLASQSKRNKERTITSIRNSAGKLNNSPVEINKIFQEYYTKLYSSDLDPNLDNTILPKLNLEQVNSLELLLLAALFFVGPDFDFQEHISVVRLNTSTLKPA